MGFDPIANDYGPMILAFGAMGGLFLLQLLVVDFAGIRAKHTPGVPVEPDPSDFYFRAVRAHANTNESIAAFVLLALFCMWTDATPSWTNGAGVAFVAARASHMVCYWAGYSIARSASFAIALLSLIALFTTGLIAAV